MLYACEINKPEALVKTVNYAYANFTIVPNGESWILEEASPVDALPKGKSTGILLKMAEEARIKYGVDDLSKMVNN